MLQPLFEAASQFTTLGIFLRLGIATLAGALIGIEREAKNKTAGIKTHVLVCVGAALCLIVGQYVYNANGGSGADITRIGSTVVSGVGFLGVGTIMVTGGREVTGLTTAAGLWCCACIGLAAGAGYIEGVIIALFFVLFTLIVVRYVDSGIYRVSKEFDLYIEVDENHNIKHLLHELRRMDVEYHNVQLTKSKAPGDGPIVLLSAKTAEVGQRESVMEAIRELDYVRYLEDY